MKRPGISVIIPVLNREKLIIRCLDSIVNQSNKPTELIVVDNGSTDDTYNAVERWMDNHSDSGIRFKLLKEDEKGACNARQKGLECAGEEFVFFFDSDDEMRPDLLDKASQRLKNNPAIDIICWKACIHQLDSTIRIPHFIVGNPIEGHLIHTLLRTQGYIIKKEFIEKAGGWSKPVKYWNDLELGLRLLLKQPEIDWINEILVDIYSQEESITGSDFSSREGEWEKTLREMEKVNETGCHPKKEKIRKILNYRKAILAAHYYREGNKKGASKLMNEALKNKSKGERLLLNFSYNYTKQGLRGVWRLVRNFY